MRLYASEPHLSMRIRSQYSEQYLHAPQRKHGKPNDLVGKAGTTVVVVVVVITIVVASQHECNCVEESQS